MSSFKLTWCKDCCHITGHKLNDLPAKKCEKCHSTNVRIGPCPKGNKRHYAHKWLPLKKFKELGTRTFKHATRKDKKGGHLK